MCDAQGQNAGTQVRLETATPLSRVKHSTTEPLRSPKKESTPSQIKIFFPVENVLIEPVHEISNNVVCATNKDSDQSAHMRSLIRAFACRLSIL